MMIEPTQAAAPTAVPMSVRMTARRSSPLWRRLGPLLTAVLLAIALDMSGTVTPAAAATITVTNSSDAITTGDGVSLREAITSVNNGADLNGDVTVNRTGSYGSSDTIQFNIAGSAPFVINMADGNELPSVTKPVQIDGLSQGGIACPQPLNPLNVEIRGPGVGAPSTNVGLTLGAGADGSSIRGLAITDFTIGIVTNGANNASIACNYLGVPADGLTIEQNSIGILVSAGTNTVVGGITPDDGNVIAYSASIGVRILGGTGTRIQGNIIRDNGNVGVSIQSGSTGNQVSRNSIIRNGSGSGVGIDLVGTVGVTLNDAGDSDSGSNNLQNFPVLASASTNGVITSVAGTLDSQPGAYTVELFSSPFCVTSGNGEGEVYLGSTSVTIPGGGFSVTSLPPVAPGRVVTATATDASNNTSEFSACVTVQAAGATATQTDGTTVVGEGAGTDVFTLALSAAPISNVTISFNTGSQVQPISDVVFTPANWNAPRLITVVAVDDAIAEGAHTGTVAMTASGADPAYQGLTLPTVTVSIVDNDAPGVTVSPTSGLVTTEAGGAATFTVQLNTPPTQPVTIGLSSSAPGEATVSPASLTFPAGTAALTPQTVTVTGVADTVADGNQPYTIVLAAAVSGDPLYNGLNPPDVAGLNQDGPLQPTLSIGAAQATEGAGVDVPMTFTVLLSPTSTRDVTVEWQVVDGTAQVGPDVNVADRGGSLTFRAGESSKPLVIRVLGDFAVEPTETFTVRLQNATNAVIGTSTATGTILDDDAPVSACLPRPDVVLTTVRSGPDRLVVTVKAGQGSLNRISFGSATEPMRNAEIEPVGPGSVVQGTGSLTPVAGTTQQSFVVHRLQAGRPVMVPIVVDDGCGSWRTFVGSGATAF